MMRNNMNHMGHHSSFGHGPHMCGFGPGPAHRMGPGPMHRMGPGPMHRMGPGPMHRMGPGPMHRMGPGFMGVHHGPRPVRRYWGSPWIRPWPRYNDGCGCLGCFGPFLMLILLASAFGFRF